MEAIMTTGTPSQASQALGSYMRAHRMHVQVALRRCMVGLGEVAPPKVHAAAAAGVLSEGKRLRPLLLITAFEELGGECTRATYDLAAAVELIHAYSLIHDDLPCMDDAQLRRGRPTVHAAHGVMAATAAGATLIPWAAAWAFDAATRGGAIDTARRIVAVLLEAAGAGGLVGGQVLDLLGEEMSLSERELAEIHSLKTGALLIAALEMGALAAGAAAVRLAAVSEFGRALGLAFQVMDDVLDATGSAESLGKQPSDEELGKSTYVTLLGVEGARERARALVHGGLRALDSAELAAPRLRQLARFVIERRR